VIEPKATFNRERGRRALATISARLRQERDDVSAMLPFEEVVRALGRRGQSDLGVRSIPLDSIVGTVDRRRREFDRAFRPSPDTRSRWERVAAARRRGEPLPPIEAEPAALIEAWGFRASHARERLLSRPEMALAWFQDEYEPVARILAEAGIGGPGTETERYLRLQTDDLGDDMIDRLLGMAHAPGASDDTMVHQILEELD
jgi:hypothetical protein